MHPNAHVSHYLSHFLNKSLSVGLGLFKQESFIENAGTLGS